MQHVLYNSILYCIRTFYTQTRYYSLLLQNSCIGGLFSLWLSSFQISERPCSCIELTGCGARRHGAFRQQGKPDFNMLGLSFGWVWSSGYCLLADLRLGMAPVSLKLAWGFLPAIRGLFFRGPMMKVLQFEGYIRAPNLWKLP